MKWLSPLLVALAIAAPATAETVLIRDGRVITNTSAGVIEGGDVLIVDGQVSAVGANIAAPRAARVIDATGKWVTPGIFAAVSQVGLSEISGSGAPNDASIEGELVSAAADAGLAFDYSVSAIPVTRIEGVTRAAIAPNGSHTMFSGIGALVSMSGQPGSVFREDAFMVLQMGEAGANRTGGSRAAYWPALEAALRDAREYPGRYRSGQGGAVLNEIDAAAVQPFANGRGLILVNVESATDIRALIRFKRSHPNLRFVINGASEGWEVATELAAANIPVIVDTMQNLPNSFEQMGSRLDNAAILSRAGVRVIIASAGDGHQARLVLQQAGNAVANGMDWNAAFASITRVPAEVFGATGLGVLQRGATADVVVWDGDPLEVKSAPTAVFIEGAEQSLTSRQTMLRDRYRPRPRAAQ
jgi:imidazolonepropionase-like amidohydrolase